MITGYLLASCKAKYGDSNKLERVLPTVKQLTKEQTSSKLGTRRTYDHCSSSTSSTLYRVGSNPHLLPPPIPSSV